MEQVFPGVNISGVTELFGRYFHIHINTGERTDVLIFQGKKYFSYEIIHVHSREKMKK